MWSLKNNLLYSWGKKIPNTFWTFNIIRKQEQAVDPVQLSYLDICSKEENHRDNLSSIFEVKDDIYWILLDIYFIRLLDFIGFSPIFKASLLRQETG